MSIGRLLNPGRLGNCLSNFKAGIAAHRALSFLSKQARREQQEIVLRPVTGGEIRFVNSRTARLVWDDLIGTQRVTKIDATGDSGFVLYGQRGAFEIRGVSDYETYCDVFVKDDYRLKTVTKSLKNVVDLGGNVGFFAMRVSSLAERVVSVEAVGGTRARYEAQRDRNNLTDKLTLVPRAISTASGETVTLQLFDMSGVSTMIEDLAGHSNRGEQRGTEDVETISIEDLLAQHDIDRVDYMKIDVEGAERLFLPGWSQEVLGRIDRLAAELHLTDAKEDIELANTIVANLKRSGMTIDHAPFAKADGSVNPAPMIYAWRGDW